MSRRTVIFMCATVALLVYVVLAVTFTRDAERHDRFTSVRIEVMDSAGTGFVTADDIDANLKGLRARARNHPRKDFDTYALERALLRLPSVEEARCVILNDGSLSVRVVPMRPVARVFDGDRSYYINAAGKRISADAGHHVDVPVVSGHFASGKEVAALLPFFAYVHSDPALDALVTSVTVDPDGDIIVIPAVTGHVINMGDTSHVADKFDRLLRFYKEVMPVRGWLCYDTVSVKWRGRVVATRASKTDRRNIPLDRLEGIVDETPDEGTVLDSHQEAAVTVGAAMARQKKPEKTSGNTEKRP